MPGKVKMNFGTDCVPSSVRKNEGFSYGLIQWSRMVFVMCVDVVIEVWMVRESFE